VRHSLHNPSPSRISQGGLAPEGLSLTEALSIARQIAAALEAAHEQLRLKKELGAEGTWPVAYANEVLCYIPLERIPAEGGYGAGW
jgi:hypothetical protein